MAEQTPGSEYDSDVSPYVVGGAASATAAAGLYGAKNLIDKSNRLDKITKLVAELHNRYMIDWGNLENELRRPGITPEEKANVQKRIEQLKLKHELRTDHIRNAVKNGSTMSVSAARNYYNKGGNPNDLITKYPPPKTMSAKAKESIAKASDAMTKLTDPIKSAANSKAAKTGFKVAKKGLGISAKTVLDSLNAVPDIVGGTAIAGASAFDKAKHKAKLKLQDWYKPGRKDSKALQAEKRRELTKLGENHNRDLTNTLRGKEMAYQERLNTFNNPQRDTGLNLNAEGQRRVEAQRQAELDKAKAEFEKAQKDLADFNRDFDRRISALSSDDNISLKEAKGAFLNNQSPLKTKANKLENKLYEALEKGDAAGAKKLRAQIDNLGYKRSWDELQEEIANAQNSGDKNRYDELSRQAANSKDSRNWEVKHSALKKVYLNDIDREIAQKDKTIKDIRSYLEAKSVNGRAIVPDSKQEFDLWSDLSRTEAEVKVLAGEKDRITTMDDTDLAKLHKTPDLKIDPDLPDGRIHARGRALDADKIRFAKAAGGVGVDSMKSLIDKGLDAVDTTIDHMKNLRNSSATLNASAEQPLDPSIETLNEELDRKVQNGEITKAQAEQTRREFKEAEANKNAQLDEEAPKKKRKWPWNREPKPDAPDSWYQKGVERGRFTPDSKISKYGVRPVVGAAEKVYTGSEKLANSKLGKIGTVASIPQMGWAVGEAIHGLWDAEDKGKYIGDTAENAWEGVKQIPGAVYDYGQEWGKEAENADGFIDTLGNFVTKGAADATSFIGEGLVKPGANILAGIANQALDTDYWGFYDTEQKGLRDVADKYKLSEQDLIDKGIIKEGSKLHMAMRNDPMAQKYLAPTEAQQRENEGWIEGLFNMAADRGDRYDAEIAAENEAEKQRQAAYSKNKEKELDDQELKNTEALKKIVNGDTSDTSGDSYDALGILADDDPRQIARRKEAERRLSQIQAANDRAREDRAYDAQMYLMETLSRTNPEVAAKLMISQNAANRGSRKSGPSNFELFKLQQKMANDNRNFAFQMAKYDQDRADKNYARQMDAHKENRAYAANPNMDELRLAAATGTVTPAQDMAIRKYWWDNNSDESANPFWFKDRSSDPYSVPSARVLEPNFGGYGGEWDWGGKDPNDAVFAKYLTKTYHPQKYKSYFGS